ncbi:MAG: nucleotidyltransferase substrate binding protein [Deltaproteobacteria bacterium]|nr:nucleotidyltransferase substrate binding protein [Deltaproteobacteria bacterium]
MTNLDIRWKQRFANYRRALQQLRSAVLLSKERQLSDLEQQGLIQGFEFVHELAWNVIKDFFEYQGSTAIMGSRDATREAFKRSLITDGEGWMDMIASRNKSSHTYNEATADEIAEKIMQHYFGLFEDFEARMNGLIDAV